MSESLIQPENFTGMVENPGKFEGEPKATAYYYALMFNGDHDGEFTPNLPDDFNPELDVIEVPIFPYFQVTNKEAEAFGDDAHLMIGDFVVIFEDDQGFVSMCAWKTREAMEHYLTKNICGY